MGSHVPKMGPHCWCFRQQKASGYLPCTVQSNQVRLFKDGTSNYDTAVCQKIDFLAP